MTAERDGKSGRGQPDLLATLPAERPPASQPAPGIDPAAIEQLLTEVRDLREQVAGLRKVAAADRPAALTSEALEARDDKLVSRVAEAARTADAPGDDAAEERIGRIEDAEAKAAAAAERIDGGLESTADRVVAGIEEAVTRIESNLKATRTHVTLQSRQADPVLEDIRTQTAGPEVRLGDGSRVVARPRLRHVDREPHPHPLQLAVDPMIRPRSASLPPPRTGTALSGA